MRSFAKNTENQASRAVLAEIANWSIEAREEDTDRYFFHFKDVGLIEQGRKNYVVGRKGTGKTAIAEYIHRQQSPTIFSKILSFGSFPFNILYDLADASYTPPNQYITVWEYVIYSCVCAMLSGNEKVSSDMPVNLRKIFDVDIESALSHSIQRITSPGFGLDIFGIGINKGPGIVTDAKLQWRQKVDGVTAFTHRYIDNCKYYVIFDALDEDYKHILEPDRRQKYFELLVSLFKAAQNVRMTSERSGSNIVPLIFIRDDIFDLCRDPDKNKWLDRSVTLNWNLSSLESLIAFRISRARSPQAHPQPFDRAWASVFSSKTIRVNRKYQRQEEAFKFMLRSTFYRPRDIISYVRECAKIAEEKGRKQINSEVIKQADGAHSEYMRREVIDEVHSIVDDIGEVLDIFSEMRKSIFSIEEFKLKYEAFYTARGESPALNSIEIVKLLYHFNVIGNVTTGNHQVYAYNTHKKTVNLSENVCIHRGLLKCLHIL